MKSWIVKSSMFAESGDVLFYKGAQGEVLRLSMGNNFADRGVRKDCLDAFGIQLHLPMTRSQGTGARGSVRQLVDAIHENVCAKVRQLSKEYLRTMFFSLSRQSLLRLTASQEALLL